MSGFKSKIEKAINAMTQMKRIPAMVSVSRILLFDHTIEEYGTSD
jgi:hypothetical protein